MSGELPKPPTGIGELAPTPHPGAAPPPPPEDEIYPTEEVPPLILFVPPAPI